MQTLRGLCSERIAMLYDVSGVVTSEVLTRLSDVASGFNATVALAAAAKGLQPFISIDFSDTSANFFQGDIDPELYEKSGDLKYPAMSLYTVSSRFTGGQKFNQWSGDVVVGIDVFLSWRNIKGRVPFDRYCDCVENAMFDVVNRVENQDWAYPVVYNGQIACDRAKTVFGAGNFRKDMRFGLAFQVHR